MHGGSNTFRHPPRSLQFDLGSFGELGEFDAPQAGQLSSDFFYLRRSSLQNDRFQAVVVVEVYMSGAENIHIGIMLDIHDFFRQVPLMVIVTDCQHANHGLLAVPPPFLDDLVADEIADEFRSRGVPGLCNAPVQIREQRLDRETVNRMVVSLCSVMINPNRECESGRVQPRRAHESAGAPGLPP
jgi:hypothetical protein